MIAAQEGHTAILKLLVEHGSDFNHIADSGVTPVWMAAQFGHVGVLKLLAKLGATLTHPKTDSGTTPIIIAAQNGHCEAVQFLFNVNQGVSLEERKVSGATALHVAAGHSSVEMVETLVSLGADLNVPGGGTVLSTPLMAACVRRSNGAVGAAARTLRIVRALLRAGAEVNKRKRDGGTALTLAARLNRLDIVVLLFAYGAAPLPRLHHGTTASANQLASLADRARRVNSHECATFFDAVVTPWEAAIAAAACNAEIMDDAQATASSETSEVERLAIFQGISIFADIQSTRFGISAASSAIATAEANVEAFGEDDMIRACIGALSAVSAASAAGSAAASQEAFNTAMQVRRNEGDHGSWDALVVAAAGSVIAAADTEQWHRLHRSGKGDAQQSLAWPALDFGGGGGGGREGQIQQGQRQRQGRHGNGQGPAQGQNSANKKGKYLNNDFCSDGSAHADCVADVSHRGPTVPSQLDFCATALLSSDMRWLLRNGKVDPDYVPLGRLRSNVWGLPGGVQWPDRPEDYKSIARKQELARVIRLAERRWGPVTHWLYHSGIRRVVHVVLLISERLWSTGGRFLLPKLPNEMWTAVLSFVSRRDWEVHVGNELSF